MVHRNVRALCMLAVLALVVLVGALRVTPTQAQDATVNLMDVNGRWVGTAEMTETDDGLWVEIKVNGMLPQPGDRAVAITSDGVCEDDFSSAGDDEEWLSPVQFYADGNADSKQLVDADLSSLYDADGSALVIYNDIDDKATDRIICGVIADGSVTMEDDAAEDEDVADEEVADEEVADEDVIDEDVIDDEDAADEDRTFEDAVREGAGALLRDVNDRPVGIAVMVEDNDGVVGLDLFIVGMAPVPGDHRAAIAETSTCKAPNFDDAGEEEYVLDDVQFYASGGADYFTTTDEFGLADLMDDDGSALVLYDDEGDKATERIICGSLIPLPDLLGMFGLSVEDFVANVIESIVAGS